MKYVVTMNKNFNLFFVQSPLQLASATQARDCLNISNSIIFINIYDENDSNYSQIMNELDNKWGKVYIFHKKNILLMYTSYIIFLLKLWSKYKNNVERFFYGDFRSPDYAIYEAIIRPRESILLDDGAVTIAMQKAIIKNRRSVFKIRTQKHKLFKKILAKPRLPNLFTFFDVDMFMLPEQVNYYKNNNNNRIISTIPSSYYFIGSKFSEANYMKESDELGILDAIFNDYHNKKLYYIPHRGESHEKLNKIRGLGFEVKHLNQPLETFYLTTDIMPEKMLSYYSTALYTCYLNFNSQVDLIAFDVRQYLTSKVSLENIDIVYDYYADIGIKIKAISL